jgi:ribosomal-protein-alanine N-acetyltransferase
MDTLKFSPFPKLSTPRLILRQIEPGDVKDLFKLRSDERIMKFINRPVAKTLDDVGELITTIMDGLTNNSAITWGIIRKDDPKLIGTIGFWRIMEEHYRAEIGYLLHLDMQGKGFMHEALEAVLDYGFRAMKLHSVEANVNPGNTASQKLLERNHFVKEAYFKENYYSDGKFLDSIIYSRLDR